MILGACDDVATVLLPGDNPHLDVVILGSCDDVATVLLPGGSRGQAHDGRLAVPTLQLRQYLKVFCRASAYRNHTLLKQCHLYICHKKQRFLSTGFRAGARVFGYSWRRHFVLAPAPALILAL